MDKSNYNSKICNAVSNKDYNSLNNLLSSYANLYSLGPKASTKLIKFSKALYERYYGEGSSQSYQGISFDLLLSKKYQNKYNNAQERGIEFRLSLTSFRNILKAKYCYYTGLPIDIDTLTVDRIDSSKGYVKGNCVACHKDVNRLKSMAEGESELKLHHLKRMVKQWEKKVL